MKSIARNWSEGGNARRFVLAQRTTRVASIYSICMQGARTHTNTQPRQLVTFGRRNLLCRKLYSVSRDP